MFSELVESLRCVRPHAAAGLVAIADEVADRDIRRGSLGCPSCHAEFPIADAVADFRLGREGPPLPAAKSRVDDELALRAGALLGLAEGGGLVVLAGEWTACAPELAAFVEPLRVLAIEPAAGIAGTPGLSLARTAGEIPLRAGSARGIALDAAHAGSGYLESAVAALVPRGRLIAPVAVPLPAGCAELARDARDWVAEKLEAPTVVPIARAPRRADGQPPASPA